VVLVVLIVEENLVVWQLHVLVGANHTMQQQRFLVCHVSAKVTCQGCAYTSPLQATYMTNSATQMCRVVFVVNCAAHVSFMRGS
jgi:hypothetical protein